MSTSEKGDKLEDLFFQYLLNQQKRGELVYGVYQAELCKIYKQKPYYSDERKGNITFDVVIELYRNDHDSPHLVIVFECKNHGRNIEDTKVREFSDKLQDVFKHNSKGVMVVASKLQSGAKNLVNSRGMGVVKYNGHGFEVAIARGESTAVEEKFLENQLFKNEHVTKPLKFSGYCNGLFSNSIIQFLANLDASLEDDKADSKSETLTKPKFITAEKYRSYAQEILDKIEYDGEIVDLERVCETLSIDLTFTNAEVQDGEGNRILGTANFDRKLIQINLHDNSFRERFTLAHEIGHFYLNHGQYLTSESVLENDLFFDNREESTFKYETLEIQANRFASYLLLPNRVFVVKTIDFCKRAGIQPRRSEQIYVNDQRSNYEPYNVLISRLSAHFYVSKQAVEIKLKNLGLLNDQRKKTEKYKYRIQMN